MKRFCRDAMSLSIGTEIEGTQSGITQKEVVGGGHFTYNILPYKTFL